MRDPKRQLAFFSLAPLAIIALSAGVSYAAPQSDNLESLGNASGNDSASNSLSAEVHNAEFDESGVFLSVTWSIENNGSSQIPLSWLKDSSYLYEGQNFASVTILDENSGTRYHPIMDGSGACLCSGEASNEFIEVLNPNEKIAYWSMFSVPNDLNEATIEIPNFDPIEDIPIS